MPFRIALSGLNAAQTDLSVTGNNIANSGTAGFKRARTEFTDVYAVAFEGISDIATGNGVAVSAVSQNFSQGNIDFTERNLDIAVSGQGFFVLADDTGQSYTRAGAFHVDRNGNVVNQGGQKLQIFPSISGEIKTGELSDLQLSTSDGPPNATSTITAALNLSSAEVAPPTAVFDPADPTSFNNSTSTVIYDSLGTSHSATLYYVKDGLTQNLWNTYLYVDGAEVSAGAVSPVPMTFNQDGTINTPQTLAYNAVPSGTGALDIQLTLDYSDTTQFGSPFAVNGLSQDGFAPGRLSGIDIDDEGVVFARYTNGQSSPLGKIALANFPNVGGLRQLGETNWAQTFDSGDLLLGEAGTSSFGLIQSGGLESSNVDIAASLVNLITAQRNFQANAQVISAADTITQTIINI